MKRVRTIVALTVAFAFVVPFHRSPLSPGKRQDMATAWTMVRFRRILVLLPACLDKGHATVLTDQGAIGG